MVGIKDLLEGWKSNNGGSERVSSGMSVLEMNRERKKITVVGRAWRYKHPPEPNGRLWATLLPLQGGTAVLAKIERIRRFLAGCFGWV
jgi:hypothetical protein